MSASFPAALKSALTEKLTEAVTLPFPALTERVLHGPEVTWVRTPEGHEIDFLARGPDGSMELIQACTDASDPVTAKRELRALVEAAAIYPDARCRLLTATQDGLPPEVPTRVIAEPAYEWML
jgi:hypothetical protein